MAILTSIFLAVLAACKAQGAALQLIPGAAWTATNTGQHIQAHGAGIIEANGIYCMIGEDKTNGTLFQNVNCYSSSNLVDWKYEGALLSRTDADVQKVASLADPNSLVERPKVVFNERTKKYVMYFHLDIKYEIAEVGIATSDTVCGKYTFHSSFRPGGRQIRDMGLFKDDDGSAYLLAENRQFGTNEEVRSITYIISLDSEYLNATGIVHTFENHAAESPAMLKKDGYYFIFSSGLSGWAPNDNYYSYAPSLAGFARKQLQKVKYQTVSHPPIASINNVVPVLQHTKLGAGFIRSKYLIGASSRRFDLDDVANRISSANSVQETCVLRNMSAGVLKAMLWL